MNILVTGGAGYIGSHVVKELRQAGHYIMVLDNLSRGHRKAVADVGFTKGDIGDKDLVRRLLVENQIDSVVHLAADSLVGESMQNPARYFDNNVARCSSFLETLTSAGVKRFVFSSTAAVYGEPEEIPITEAHPTKPTSVYGVTKLMVEEMLKWYGKILGLRWISLRYFNAAGADNSSQIGEDHDPETHLVPLVIKTALGIRDRLSIYGADYPTPDGTGIRDYIHVTDLSNAHLLSLEALKGGAPGGVYNLGSEKGFSVLDVIRSAEEVTGLNIPTSINQRRSGDPAVLVASSQKIRRELGWEPRYTELRDIILTAWEWHRKHPGGYDE